MTDIIDISGRTFGKLTVVEMCGHYRRKQTRWLCRCTCGIPKVVIAAALMRGSVKTCGFRACRRSEIPPISRTTEYQIYRGIINRCENPNVKSFSRYGGRGIRVCERWRGDFTNFLNDMGPRPGPKHQVDRIDNDGHYEPANCRWVTVKEQVRNRRITRWVEYRGERMALTAAVEMAGNVIHYEAAWVRITDCGWPVATAVETPRTHLSPNSNERRHPPQKPAHGAGNGSGMRSDRQFRT